MAAFFLACIMLFSGVPVNVLAAGSQETKSLCQHHLEHTAGCGYTEGSEAAPCTHQCGEDCYSLVTQCLHEHTEGCFPAEGAPDNGAAPEDGEGQAPTECTHECSEDSGCIKETLNCQHEHDEVCGYSPATEGTPCTFVCEICNSQEQSMAEDKPNEGVCTCTSLCTEGAVDASCPVCGTEGADLAACQGEPAPEETTCTCTALCTEGAIDASCPMCGTEGTDLTLCMGKVNEVQAMIDALPTVEAFEAMEEAAQAEVLAQIEAIHGAIAAMDEDDAAKLDNTRLDALAYLVQGAANNIDRIIVEDSAKLENGEANIEKHSDSEYTISYPGATKDTPLKYNEDFIEQLSHFSFSANVSNTDGSSPQDQPNAFRLNQTKDSNNSQSKGALDHSEITDAVDEDGNIPAGKYTMKLDLSKIESNVPIVKSWKTIGFADKSQVITIHVEVGTTWADRSIFDDYRITTVSSDNITFNLFDYWVDGETAHTHINPGINAKKTQPTCGIPSCIGETQKVLEKSAIPGSGYKNTGYYKHGINANHALVFSPAGNESGGWNFDTGNNKGESFNKFKGGPYYGLVKNRLGEDGYPVLNLDQDEVNKKSALQGQERPANESLAYLFSPNMESDGKKVYTDVDGLLKRDPETGYYKYNSLENFASFDSETNSFDVYNSWGVTGGASEKGQFFPFNTAAQVFEIESGKLKSIATGVDDAFFNHYFGLTMEVTFQQPVDGKISNMGAENPMTFRFSGDDDVWIFIDGVLVADIGGIHSTQTATINFATGDIKVDCAARFNDETTNFPESRKETTIREQFETALGKDFDESIMDGDTFGDNTVHTLTMFYMERGNQASNLELEFNLQAPHYSSLEKVDQDGLGLEGVEFELYEANANWEPIGDAIATLTTGEDGAVDFAIEENGLKKVIVFKEDQNYLLRETKKPLGFVTQDNIHLKYHGASGTLKVENKWETGAVGGFNARLTMTRNLMSAKGHDLTEDARGGLIIAVPMYNPIDRGAEATEGWLPLYGSAFDGFQVIEMEGKPDTAAYSKATMEAAFRQFSNPDYEHWHLYWNEGLQRYEGTLNDLPGAVENYAFINKEKGQVLTAYYLFDPKDDLFEGCSTDEEKCERLAELVAEGDIETLVEKYNRDFTLLNMENFNRQFYSRLYIPNKARDLWVQKQDENGKSLAGAEFTLYSDAACTTAVAKGITNDGGYVSFSAQNTGNNAVEKPGGGLSSEVYYPLMRNRNGNVYTDGKLWLKETKAPEGYAINPTVTKVLITRDYLYADAGNTTDNVSVARGLGSLVETMVRYASDGAIDITLRDITATGFKYTGNVDDQAFPLVEIPENWSKDHDTQPLNLHFGLGTSLLDYGLGTSLLDYGLHEGKAPAFLSEEGWYGVGVAQNWSAHRGADDPYNNSLAVDQDLSGYDISALFTGSTTIIYKDKPNGPDPGDGDDDDDSDLRVIKVDEGGKVIGQRAVFIVYKKSGGKTLYRTVTGSKWTENRSDAWKYSTKEGSFTIYDLEPGTYYIEEITAPYGYERAREPLKVVVGERDTKALFENKRIPDITTDKPNPYTGG